MHPATVTLVLTVARLLKGVIGAFETWARAKEEGGKK